MTEKNTAQSLLEKLTADAKNTVTIDIQGVEFTFNKDAAGNSYQAGVFFAYEACALGYRRGGEILDNYSKFVGHFIK